MARKSEQILVRVTPNRKQRWQEQADEEGFGLSEFVRHAVENEIDGRGSGDGDSLDTEAVNDAVSEAVANEIQPIQQQLSSITGAIEGIQEEVGGDSGTVAAELVMDATPSVKRTRVGDDEWEIDGEPATPQAIAEEIGVPTPPVRRTLENLAVKSEYIQSIEEDNGERRYYVRG